MALPDPDTGADSEIGETGRQLADARPTVDHAAMEDVRCRAEAGLFGSAAPPRLGRFVLLKQIAGGGMGMIHRAYDPQLERAVALKVLHPRLRLHDTDRG